MFSKSSQQVRYNFFKNGLSYSIALAWLLKGELFSIWNCKLLKDRRQISLLILSAFKQI